jgi:hypothetical protein
MRRSSYPQQSFLGRDWLGQGILIGLALVLPLVVEPSAHAQEPTHSAGEPPAIELPPEPIESLHHRIDRLLAAPIDSLAALPESDSLRLRRLSLDLRNVPPSAAELDEFMADTRSDRWSHWVTRFLDDPLHRERMVEWLDRTLMQRRSYTHVDRASWLAYLRGSVDARKGIDVLLREMVTSVWWNRSQRAQQRFFLERGGDPHMIARDVGRIFFGRDLQCAQCHNHPNVDDYLQTDYHGLLAFFAPSGLQEAKYKDDKGAEQKLQMYVERSAADAAFESVFDKGKKLRTASRLFGQLESMEPYLAPDQRYQPQAHPETMEGVPNPPIRSRRELLASQLTGENQAFVENWANRLWAFLFGQGLVHPLDMHHADNPASHPELLAELSKALIEARFDPRTLLEQIALSQSYQKAHRAGLPARFESTSSSFPQSERSKISTDIERLLATDQEQLRRNKQRMEHAEAQWTARSDAWRSIQGRRTELRAALDTAEAAFQEASKKATAAVAASDKATLTHKQAGQRVTLLEEAAGKLEQAKALGDDPELQGAIAVARAKSEAAKGQLPGLEKAAADAATARDTARQAVENERGKWQAAADPLAPVESELTTADKSLIVARQEFQQSKLENIRLHRRIAQWNRIKKWLELKDQDPQVQQQLAQSRSDHSAQVQRMQLAQEHEKRTQQEVAAAQEMVRQHASLMAATEAQRKSLEAEIARLMESNRALEASQELVTGRDALLAARKELDQAIAQRDTKCAELQTQWDQAQVAGRALEAAHAALLEKMQEHARERAAITQSLEDSQRVVQQAEDLRKSLTESQQVEQSSWERGLENQFGIYPSRILSPEQMGLSILHVTGVLGNYIQSEMNELEKASPLPADAPSPVRQARKLQAVRQAIDKLRGNVDAFANLYSTGVGQTADDFFASPDQALYMSNGGAAYNWSVASGANVTQSVVSTKDANLAARQLYWGLLSREPSRQEQSWIAEQLSVADDHRAAIAQDLVWSILASVEFRMYP